MHNQSMQTFTFCNMTFISNDKPVTPILVGPVINGYLVALTKSYENRSFISNKINPLNHYDPVN